MKRMLAVLVMAAAAASVFAGGLRLGAEVSAEFVDRPDFAGVTQAFDEGVNLVPGLYLELAGRNLGVGLTALVDLSRVSVPAPVSEELWLDWIGSLDLRYHILGSDAFLDPFVEAGLGAAGRSDITDYEALGAGTNDYTPTNLSLFGQVGGGLALKLSIFQLGAKADWRFWNGPMPGASQDAYPLKSFSVALFGGLAF